MLVQHLLGVRLLRVDQHQRLLVAAAVGQCVEALVVGGEELRVDLGLVVGRDDGLERAGGAVAVQHRAVGAVARHRHAHAAGMVGLPADDVAGVLRHQRRGAGLQVDAEHVEHLGIALVVADQHVARVVGQVVLQRGAHARVGRQVADLAGERVDGHHVEVLVAAEVLVVQDPAAALPVVEVDVARGLLGELPRLADQPTSLQRLHEDVAPLRLAGGLHEAQRPAVFGQPEVGLRRVAEEILDGVGGRCRRGGGRCGARLGQRG